MFPPLGSQLVKLESNFLHHHLTSSFWLLNDDHTMWELRVLWRFGFFDPKFSARRSITGLSFHHGNHRARRYVNAVITKWIVSTVPFPHLVLWGSRKSGETKNRFFSMICFFSFVPIDIRVTYISPFEGLIRAPEYPVGNHWDGSLTPIKNDSVSSLFFWNLSHTFAKYQLAKLYGVLYRHTHFNVAFSRCYIIRVDRCTSGVAKSFFRATRPHTLSHLPIMSQSQCVSKVWFCRSISPR